MASERSAAAERAQAGLARVDSLMDAGALETAVQDAQALFGQMGDDPLYGWQIEGRLGTALLRAGSPGEALPHLESVLRRNPQDHVSHRNFASALWALGRKGRALSEFRTVVELAPADYEARLEFGQVLVAFGDVGNARMHLEVARSLCPECTEPDRALAAASLSASDFASALAPLERLMDRDPNPWTRRNLGLALAGAGRDADLLAFLDGMAPEGLTAEEMNLVVEAEGRHKEGPRTLVFAKAADEAGLLPGGWPEGLLTNPVFWGRVSLNLLESGQFAEGLEAADRAIRLDERNVVYRNNRVVLLLKLGREEDARREWKKVLELDPSLEQKESE